MTLRTDTAVVPLPATIPNVGGLTGKNTIVTDPDFDTKIVRLTDGTSGKGAGRSMQTIDDSNANLWNTDDTMIVVRDTASTSYIIQFNPSTMQGTQLPGSYTGNLSFSMVNNNILYQLGPNGAPTALNRLTFTLTGGVWTLTNTTKIADFASTLPAGFNVLWSGAFSHSKDDSTFCADFSEGVQNSAHLVIVWNQTNGYRMLDTLSGTITGAWGTNGHWSQDSPFPNFHYHEAFMTRNPNYVIMTISPNDGGGVMLWNIPTLTLTYFTSGHHAMGMQNYYSWGLGGGAQSAAPYTDITTNHPTVPDSELPAHQTPPQSYTGDQHGSFGLLSSTDNSIVWALGYTTEAIRAAWMNEIHGYAVNGTALAGPVYRACHSFGSAKSQEFIVQQNICVPSQTGNFVAWTSDWMGTLGSNSGGTHGTLGIDARGDVFVVQTSATTGAGGRSPVISWFPTPTTIQSGSPLTTGQLNATASVAGAFVYSPAVGTILSDGPHTIQVTFNPTDTTNYDSVVSFATVVVSGGVVGTGGNVAGRVYSLHSSFGKIGYPLPPKQMASATITILNQATATVVVTLPITNFQDIWKWKIVDLASGLTCGSFLWNIDVQQSETINAPSGVFFTQNSVFAIYTYNTLGEESEPLFAINPVISLQGYEISLFVSGVPNDGQTLIRHTFAEGVSYPATLPNSQATAGITSTDAVVWPITRTTFTGTYPNLTPTEVNIGEVHFTTDVIGATFFFPGDVSFNQGDVLTIYNQTPTDASLADINIVIVGNIT